MSPAAAPNRKTRAHLACAQALVLALMGCGGSGGGDPPAAGGGPVLPGGGGGPIPPPIAALALDVSDLVATPGASRGQVVLRFTAPAGTGGGAVDSYVVRSQIRHITSANYLQAPTVPHGTTPHAPGTLETITLVNLEAGQTLQFSVQAVRGGVQGPFSYGVGCRVAEGTPPTPPQSRILVSGPSTLSQDGAYYLVSADFSCSGTAFTITGRNVTLDLGGRTVTYGTGVGAAFGVYSQWLYTNGLTTVMNGAFVQGAGGTANCPAIWFRGGHDIRVSKITATVYSTDSDGIAVSETPTGSLRVDHCTVRCNTTVVTQRSYPGVGAIWVEGVTAGAEIDHNLISTSPQWGIKVQGRQSNGAFNIHHNRVVGTKTRVANGYMVGVHKPFGDVFENYLSGESRGIHMDGVDNFGNDAEVHDNFVSAQDQPNAEYPVHWCHGIKIEAAARANVHHNRVSCVADPQHAEVKALDIQIDKATGIVITKNWFSAASSAPQFLGEAVSWTQGVNPPPSDLVCKNNVFRATDMFVYRYWASQGGGVLRDNVWERDLTQGAGHPFLWEYFDTSDDVNYQSHGHRFLDAHTSEDMNEVGQWANPSSYDSTREWTLRTAVQNGQGVAVAGAGVTVRDRDGAVVFTGTTDAQGFAQGTVVAVKVTNGPAFNDRNPFAVSVSKAGVGSYAGSWPITGRTALLVNLGAGTASADVSGPAAPAGIYSHVLSASRILVRWTPVSDESGVTAYLVYLGGQLVGFTDEPWFSLAGLSPSSAYTPSVRAMDAGGNLSPLLTGFAISTWAEDRGP